MQTMSADNCVAILKTPYEQNGFEYRVTHAQAIENIHYKHEDGNPEQIVNYFGQCVPFVNENEAIKFAQKMADEILSDYFCPILEYGICQIDLPHPFSYYVEKNKQNKEKEKSERTDQDSQELVN